MKRKILLSTEDSEPPERKPTYPITTVKAGLARGFTTIGLRTALNNLSRDGALAGETPRQMVMDSMKQEVMLRLWMGDDEHTAEAVNNPIHLITPIQQDEEGDSSWIEQEVLIGVLSVQGLNPLGFYIRGGAQVPFHMSQVVVRTLSPAFASEEILELHPDNEGPALDHGWLAFIAWRIAMTLTMDDQESVAEFVNVKSTALFHEFMLTPVPSISPLVVSLHTFGASGESTDDSLNNAIWREAGDPVRSEEDPHPSREEPMTVLPPIYKERRTSLHINLGGDFWVEETRCPRCAQRLIIHAPASMCPSGRPVGLTVKCGACKSSFGWP